MKQKINLTPHNTTKREFISVVKLGIRYRKVKLSLILFSKLNLLVINLLIKGPLCSIMVFHSVCEMRNITFYESEQVFKAEKQQRRMYFSRSRTLHHTIKVTKICPLALPWSNKYGNLCMVIAKFINKISFIYASVSQVQSFISILK